MVLLWQFLALMAVHWLGDFVCQTHWQASNKSKRMDALLRHVGAYTLVLALFSLSIMMPGARGLWWQWAGFVLVNGVLHLATDYVTSRWAAQHFKLALDGTVDICVGYSNRDPGRHWHNFFVIIGLDQLIHAITLGVTLAYFTGEIGR